MGDDTVHMGCGVEHTTDRGAPIQTPYFDRVKTSKNLFIDAQSVLYDLKFQGHRPRGVFIEPIFKLIEINPFFNILIFIHGRKKTMRYIFHYCTHIVLCFFSNGHKLIHIIEHINFSTKSFFRACCIIFFALYFSQQKKNTFRSYSVNSEDTLEWLILGRQN